MPSRPILNFPDPRLRVAAASVTRFDADLRELAADLLDTMREAPGIGITAPHVGVLLRLVVLELVPGDVRTYVNPVLDNVSRETIRHVEGSVSMPGVTDELERHAHVRVRYRDLDGVEHVEDADGLLAVCHQHEIDQLDGLFWIDRLSRLKRDRLIARYNKLRRG
ncbi:peptide deformylase [Bosea sp. SSUT16]|uniref:Peptide deformylase-like n=1 Tax=Bosea spartocytisi TaxID=2773451 RepID=A0A927HZW4_9HYPH|nr:peptide deformylase [Bosea spartocytisi]MBD3846674.1 peptide deformylase [Bosea spartocytisi]MCT4473691.1 peptide deformylase [Bosea spartocytisi]